MRAVAAGAVVGVLWALSGASSVTAQQDTERLERELRGDEVPKGAAVPAPDSGADAADDAAPPEPPPLDASYAAPDEPAVLSEDELAIDDAAAPDAGVTLGFVIGWGVALEQPNPWAFGIGIQGSYTAENQLHLAGRFVYFLGQAGQNIFDFGLEGGYAIEAGVLRAIPVVGVGIAFLSVGSESSPEGYVAPGLKVRLQFDGFFFGIEARWQVIFTDPVRMGILPMAAVGLSY